MTEPVSPATVQAVTERLAAPPYGKPNLLMLPVHADGVFIAWYRSRGPTAWCRAARAR